MSAPSDFLDELITEGMCEDPAFAELVDAAASRRALLRGFGHLRESLGISREAVAERMGTQQLTVTRLERGESDPKLSILERYAAAIGLRLEVRRTENAAACHQAPESPVALPAGSERAFARVAPPAR